MQNLRQYYGVGIRVSRDIELQKYESSRKQVKEVISQLRLDDGDEYGLYVTKIELYASEDEHFGVGPLDKRLKHVQLNIAVNRKQREEQSIVFLNERIPQNVWLFSNTVRPTVERFSIKSSLESPFRTEGSLLEVLVLTGVRRDVRARDRKLKVSVVAYPTPSFAQRLHNFTSVATKLDYQLDREVQLSLQM